MDDLNCTACGRKISIDEAAYNDYDEPFHITCLQNSDYHGQISFKPRSRCLDCEAVFQKPLAIEVVGETPRFHCPECKGDQLELITPELPGMSMKMKVNLSFDKNVRLFPSGHPAPLIDVNIVDDDKDPI